MREILFRGKRVDNGEWVEGFYYIATSGYAGSDEVIGKPRHMITTGRWEASGAYGERNELAEHKVIPESIGQFTGMKDKNGKRVYEGDIVTTDIERPYLIVEFRDGCFMFNCNDGGKDYYDIMLPIVDEPHTEYKYGEVIGNIHDNPELMEDV